jgi:hypothetical protein
MTEIERLSSVSGALMAEKKSREEEKTTLLERAAVRIDTLTVF